MGRDMKLLGHQLPTVRQLEAVSLVCFQGLTQQQAATKLGVSQPDISKLLKAAGNTEPIFKQLYSRQAITRRKHITYNDNDDYDIENTL